MFHFLTLSVFKMHGINVNIVFVWALMSFLFIIQWLLHWYWYVYFTWCFESFITVCVCAQILHCRTVLTLMVY